jgi:hypothetical protein
MGKPITTTEGGICFAFPDVCTTPAAPSPVPVPYPNIGQLADATLTATNVNARGNPVVLQNSTVSTTTGDEAGTAGGGVQSGTIKGPVTFTSFSSTVKANGQGVVRMFDSTDQNKGTKANAVGTVLGGVPTVLVGD